MNTIPKITKANAARNLAHELLEDLESRIDLDEAGDDFFWNTHDVFVVAQCAMFIWHGEWFYERLAIKCRTVLQKMAKLHKESRLDETCEPYRAKLERYVNRQLKKGGRK